MAKQLPNQGDRRALANRIAQKVLETYDVGQFDNAPDDASFEDVDEQQLTKLIAEEINEFLG